MQKGEEAARCCWRWRARARGKASKPRQMCADRHLASSWPLAARNFASSESARWLTRRANRYVTPLGLQLIRPVVGVCVSLVFLSHSHWMGGARKSESEFSRARTGERPVKVACDIARDNKAAD